jgi:hypothetical protein
MARNDVVREFLLTTAEAAQFLRIQPQTLRRWRCEGRGPRYIRLSSNRCLYPRTSVDDFLARREFESTNDEAASTALRRASISAA